MVIVKQVYTKPDATFATGDEAYADKNSKYPPELAQKLEEFRQLIRDKGILLEDEQHEWDQATHRLTITRKLIDHDVFVAEAEDFYPLFRTSAFEDYAAEAGWTKVETTQTVAE